MKGRQGFGRLPHPRPDSAPADRAPNGRPYESVWSYPRPPEMRPESRAVTVTCGGRPIARSERALRVCETAGAPTIYVPTADVAAGALRRAPGKTLCEWKGSAAYFDIVVPGTDPVERAAWTYPRPTRHYAELSDHVSFFPALVDCRLGDEAVAPQPGGFYGGWVTAEILGPIKGEPGSEGW
ncbi:MAG TPA: DUF427 domain-containing protein [Solirubrobacterales bacterium]|nr:DUF427 domain-containing protein [Solirubrobacterales bacterium]